MAKSDSGLVKRGYTRPLEFFMDDLLHNLIDGFLIFHCNSMDFLFNFRIYPLILICCMRHLLIISASLYESLVLMSNKNLKIARMVQEKIRK
jgi:hypothetical protein